MEFDPQQKTAQEQFGKQAHKYGAGHILENIDDVKAATSHLTLPAKADVLDVAAATGHTGLYFAQLGHRVILADIAAPMLDRAEQAAMERGLTIGIRQHAAEELPYDDARFDLVTCRVAAHHFSSPQSFVQESARVLRPGGFLLLIDSSVPDGAPEAEEWLHKLEKWRDPSHGRFLSPQAWRTLCEDAGLTIKSVEMHPLKQPDLEWYFQTAATSPENMARVREHIAHAPEEARRLFNIQEENGTTVWWWPRLTLIAQKPA